MPNSTYFETSSSTANGVTCYKVTGCKSPYSTSGTNLIAMYEPQGYKCYEKSYFSLNSLTIDDKEDEDDNWACSAGNINYIYANKNRLGNCNNAVQSSSQLIRLWMCQSSDKSKMTMDHCREFSDTTDNNLKSKSEVVLAVSSGNKIISKNIEPTTGTICIKVNKVGVSTGNNGEGYPNGCCHYVWPYKLTMYQESENRAFKEYSFKANNVEVEYNPETDFIDKGIYTHTYCIENTELPAANVFLKLYISPNNSYNITYETEN